MKRLDVDVRDAPEVVAACVLHNICEIHGDTFNEEWMEGVERLDLESTSARASSAQPAESAVDIRKAFMSYFNQ